MRDAGTQIFTNFAANFVGVCKQIIKRLILCQPFYSCFGAAFLYSWNIIYTVSNESEVINDLFRCYTKFCFDTINIHTVITHGIDEGDMFIDQLCHVFITG
ncbi:Uncharacterised protein [Legionella pneumophila]|nr:Uncharacterised protein [Legionella pneumophila]